MSLFRALSPLVDFVFPPRCPLCGTAVGGQTGLCASCWGELAIPGEPACGLCSRPFDGETAHGAICGPCLAEPPRHGGIAAATLYNEQSRKLVLSLKHGGRIALAPLMARLMAAKLPMLDAEWMLVPVPLHRWRLWRRGYNQAALLARELGRQSGASVHVDALVRRKRTVPLGGLGRKARRRELSGAIAVGPRVERLRGRKVVLVDDVLTSGATSAACVSAMLRAGADTVIVACFARVLE